MTLSVEIQTFMASQVDKVVQTSLLLHKTENWSAVKSLLAEVLSKGPEVPLAHPYLRGTSISRYLLTEKLAPNVSATQYPPRKHGTLRQESDVRAI